MYTLEYKCIVHYTMLALVPWPVLIVSVCSIYMYIYLKAKSGGLWNIYTTCTKCMCMHAAINMPTCISCIKN